MAKPHPPTAYSKQEMQELSDYVIQNVKDAVKPLNLTAFCKDFVKETGSARSADRIRHTLKARFAEEMQKNDSIDMDMKVRILFVMGLSIGKSLLKKVQKSGADIELSPANIILKYKRGKFKLDAYNKNGTLNYFIYNKMKKSASDKSSKRRQRKRKNDEEELDDDIVEIDNDLMSIRSIKREQRVGAAPTNEQVYEEEYQEDIDYDNNHQVPVFKSNLNSTSLYSQYFINQEDYSQASRSSILTDINGAGMELVEFYQHLKYLVLSLDSSGFEQLKESVNEKIGKCVHGQMVPLKQLYFVMKSTLNFILMHSMPMSNATSSTEQFIDLPDFLMTLQMILINMEIPELADLQTKIESVKEEAGNLNKKISTGKICLTLQNAIAMVS